MNKAEKIATVREQLAAEWQCTAEVFNKGENVYLLSDSVFFEMITFGSNIVVRADAVVYDWCVEQFKDLTNDAIMNGETLFRIEVKLREHGQRLAGEHIRYLYTETEKEVLRPHGFDYRLFDRNNIKELYGNRVFRNALNYKDDVIAFGAFDEGNLVALAGADDRNPVMWQIGVDTLPAYRKKGLGVYVVKRLADEIEKRNALSYYTIFGSNIASMTVAIKTGFSPVWCGYYSRIMQ